jgi:hypothetical protein
MIATSIAARGLDVKDLNLVVNYDVPNHMEDYVHRVGRTGRAGASGTAYTFITPEEEQYAPDILKALQNSHAVIPEELIVLAEGTFFDIILLTIIIILYSSYFIGVSFFFFFFILILSTFLMLFIVFLHDIQKSLFLFYNKL